MRAIPIDVVRAFVAVVEARGFTRAAEDLGRSQPTVSLQVKRLEELVEAPLFENASRFELTTVGSVCLDYGRRLLKLHDEMLDKAARCKAPGATLRIGMPGEFAHELTPQLESLRAAASRASLEVVTGESDALGVAFRQNALDIALLVGDPPEEEVAGRWRAPLGWYEADGEEGSQKTLRLFVPSPGSGLHEAAPGPRRALLGPYAPDGEERPPKSLRLVVAPPGSGLHEAAPGPWRAPLGPYAPERKERPPEPLRIVVPQPGSTLHEAAVSALRAAGRPFEIVCASADFAVRSAAVAVGLGVAPMIDGLAPHGVVRSADPDLPALPELEVSLVARGEALASAARRWAGDALAAFRSA